MRLLKPKRLSDKIFGYTMLFYLLVVCAITFWQVAETYRGARQGFFRELKIYESTFSKPLAKDLWSMDMDKVSSLIQGIVQIPEIVGVRIVDPNTGSILARRGWVPHPKDGIERYYQRDGTAVEAPVEKRVEDLFDFRFRLFHQLGDKDVLIGEVTLFSDTGVIIDRIKYRVVLMIAGAGAQIFFLWMFFSWISRRYLSRPLLRLKDTVESFDLQKPEESPQSLLIEGEDELAILSRAFSAMQKRLVENVRSLKQNQLELRHLNENLEEIVLERTAELRKLSEAVEQSPASVVITDKNGTIEYINRTFSEVTGYSVEEAIGQNPRILKSGQTLPETYQELWETITAGKEWRGELINKKKNGELYWESVSISPIIDDGSIQFYLAIKQDITEQKRAQEALRKSEERFALTTSGSGDGLWDFDLPGDFFWYSDRFRELLGYSNEEDYPNRLESWSDGLHPEDREATLNAFTGHLEGGKPYDVEYRLQTKQGEWRWFRARGKSLRDENGRSYRAAGSITDITERKQAEEALRKSEERFALTTSGSGDGLWDFDLPGEFFWYSDRFRELLGYSNEEDYPNRLESWSDGLHPEDREATLNAFTAHLERGETYDVEYRLQTKQGEWRWFRARGKSLRDENGRSYRAAGSITDITEQKHLEEDLQARVKDLDDAQSAMLNMMEDLDAEKAKAEDATRAKSDFLANMSHEIRTPMNAVIGMAHLASKTEMTPKQQDYLNKIQSSANSLLGIINDILDFSKIEAGKLDMEAVEFDLSETLDNVANVITVKAQEKENLEVLFYLDSQVPNFLVGDSLRLNQILVNLGNNAVKFTEKGEIVLTTKIKKRSDDKVTLQFSIRDTGIGMTEEQQAKLFQAFSQADTSTTRKFGGTGLGLTISKRLVNMMGGEIWVESESGHGTTFSFNADFGLGKKTVKRRLVVASDLRGLKVLVVDDNATSREILQDILESFSFEVFLAASGKEALEEVERADKDQPFELVIMDWKMPGMDGIEASRRIKNNQVLSQSPPIILVTAYGREEIMERADEIGLEGFLLKPVSSSMLFDAIMQALEKEVHDVPRAGRKKEQSAEELHAISGARVLLVEDNEINQQVAQEILQGAGLIVTVANNGQEGVDAVKKNQYDVILMDIQMPVMDGYTATREIRNLKSEIRNVPIIAMTAHAMAGDEARSLDAGMNNHVTKPIDPDQLFAVLNKWIQPIEKRATAQKPVVSFEPPEEDKVVSIEAELPESLPGFDLADGLKRLQGNKKLYRKLLLNFATDYYEVANEIREALAAEDFEHAHSLVHNLKGLAGNLAATDLQAAAVNMEKLVKGAEKKAPSFKQLNLRISELETALNRALESVKHLGAPLIENAGKLSDEKIAAIPTEIAQDIAKRIRDAAEMGDVTTLNAIAEEIRTRSDSCMPLSKQIVQMAGDFDLDGIQKLADALDAG